VKTRRKPEKSYNPLNFTAKTKKERNLMSKKERKKRRRRHKKLIINLPPEEVKTLKDAEATNSRR